ncbi:MAG: phage terminase large subunit, partial [Leptolyngbya sp.]|nr:phage terminase large subunit [Leptolyngbya sp.]
MSEGPPTQPETRRVKLNAVYRALVDGSLGTRYAMVTGGRGSGKSYAVTLALAMMLREPGYRILFTRYTLTAAKDSIIPEFLEKVDILGCASEFEASQNSVVNTVSGSEILFRGIKTSSGNQTAKLKSLQGINVWVLDEAEELDDEETFDRIDLSIRDRRQPNLVLLVMNPPHKAHWLYGRFFAGLGQEFCGQRDGVTYIHSTYEDNRRNLPETFVSLAAKLRDSNPTRYNHIWRGHWADQAAGALWTWDMIDRYRHRVGALPAFRRVVVAIDPAVTSSDDSDETGIVCAAADLTGGYYVLSDLTKRATPHDWATTAIGEYRRRQADRIVAETNNGGDMVEATIRNVDGAVSYQKVTASRGKMVRAEPVAALYEQGLVHHVGSFPALETEMMTYTGASTQDSPNRMDALVWALSALMDGSGHAAFA